MPGIKCNQKTEDGKCEEIAHALSMQDSPNYKDGVVVDYWRTTTYKCPAGHKFKKDSIYKPKPAEPKTPTRKRPTQKGYKHTANPTLKPAFRGGVTNHQRHVARRIQREQQAKMKVVANNG